MEPPPFGDGNPKTVSPMLTTWALQWSHRLSAMETWAQMHISGLDSPLQWSYRLSAMETGVAPVETKFEVKLQWSHRLSAMETGFRSLGRGYYPGRFNGATAFRRWKHRQSAGHVPRSIRFNGATAFRRWKPEDRVPHVDHLGASMEPPPFGDGNPKTVSPMLTTWALQWSHRLSAMETRRPCPPC